MAVEPKVAPETIPSKAASPAATKPADTKAAAKRTTTVRRVPVKRTVKKSATASQLAEKQVIAKEISTDSVIKSGKIKMERDSFTMPRDEYAQLDALKARLLALGHPAKKSELLRAGIKQLVAMTDFRLKKAMADVPVIKTGRPKKKKS